MTTFVIVLVLCSEIPVNLESPLAPLSYAFFLSFVFLIVVVLMNLLNGLAVREDNQYTRDTVSLKSEIFLFCFLTTLGTSKRQ